jgi:hypothetical protein
MKNITQIALAFLLLAFASGCSKTELNEISPSQTSRGATRQVTSVPIVPPVKLNSLSVFRNSELVTISYVVITNPVVNTPLLHEFFAYAIDPGNPQANRMTPVIDGIENSGNTLWAVKKIRFNAGFAPRQFSSRVEIDRASRGIHPEISIEPNGILYQGNVITAGMQLNGSKPAQRMLYEPKLD